MERKVRTIQILQAAGYVLLGIILVWNPGMSVKIICGGCGIGAVAYGLLHMLQSRRGMRKGELVLGVVFAALGAFCLITPETVVSFLPFLLGIVLILDGIGKIQRALDLRVLDLLGWVRLLIFGILLLGLGILLLFNPFGAVKMSMIFFGACLIGDGALDLLFLLLVCR